MGPMIWRNTATIGVITMAILAWQALALPAAQAQTTRYVATSGINGGDCASASAPCATIGYAVDQAVADDVIAVAAGVYTESLDLRKSLLIRGAGRDETILQAAASAGTANRRVVTVSAGISISLQDLGIRHGLAAGSSPANRGGGIYSDRGRLVLERVRIADNQAFSGGGMFNITGSAPRLVNTSFAGNRAVSGGAMRNASAAPPAHPVIINSIVWNNRDNTGVGTPSASILNDSGGAQASIS